MPRRLTAEAFEIYRQHMAAEGFEVPQLYWMAGFGMALGIMAGTLDLGLPAHLKSSDLLKMLQDEMKEWTRRDLQGLLDKQKQHDAIIRQLLGGASLADAMHRSLN